MATTGHWSQLERIRGALEPEKLFQTIPGIGKELATLGASINVPLLDGQMSIDVPAGIQPDTVLRLHGKGLPSFGGGSRGDLCVRLQVHVPERLSDRQRHLFEELKAATPRKAG